MRRQVGDVPAPNLAKKVNAYSSGLESTPQLVPHHAERRRPIRRTFLIALCGLAAILAAHFTRQHFWLPDESTLASISLAEVRRLAQQHPSSEVVFFHLGQHLASAGRRFEAVTAFDQAAANDPNSARAVEGAARVLVASGQMQDAALHFRWTLRIEPERGSARRALARLYQTLGDWGNARTQHEWVIARHPQDAEAWNRLGQCLSRLGERSAARAALGRAVEFAPDNTSYRLDLRAEVDRQFLRER